MPRAATVSRILAIVLMCLPSGLAGCGGLGEFGETKAPSEDYASFRNSLNRVGFYGPFKIGKVRPGKVRWKMEFAGIDAPEQQDVRQDKGEENPPAKRKRMRRKGSKSAVVRFHLKPALRDGFRINFRPADDAIASFRKLKPGETVTIEGTLSFIMFEKFHGQSVLPSGFELSRKMPIDEENDQIKWNGRRTADRMRVGLLLVVGDVRPVKSLSDTPKSP